MDPVSTSPLLNHDEFSNVLERLIANQDLPTDSTTAVMNTMMSGTLSEAQIAGFLVALRAKGATATEVAGLVNGMRAHGKTVAVPEGVVDTCGTGGDKLGTFNVSTVAAVVTAAAGAVVAKHGNRSASSKCGSADLLEGWGVQIDLPPEAVSECINTVGIGFCFAPVFHPSMRHVGPARKALKLRTIFNVLGPLTNPAGAQHQTIGVPDPGLAELMAQTLATLGTGRVLVVSGSDGLDELSTTGPSQVWDVQGTTVSTYHLDPADHGIPRATVADLKGGDLDVNMAIANGILGGEHGAPRDIVVLGAAAALIAANLEEDWDAALARATTAIDSGAALALRDRWVEVSQSLA